MRALFSCEAMLAVWNYSKKKIVSMIRKYHNHKLQTNPWHREEEPHSNHETPGRQTKQKKTKNCFSRLIITLMQVKSITDTPREHSAILSTCIKLQPVFETFVLSIFEWPLKTGFTVSSLHHHFKVFQWEGSIFSCI